MKYKPHELSVALGRTTVQSIANMVGLAND